MSRNASLVLASAWVGLHALTRQTRQGAHTMEQIRAEIIDRELEETEDHDGGDFCTFHIVLTLCATKRDDHSDCGLVTDTAQDAVQSCTFPIRATVDVFNGTPIRVSIEDLPFNCYDEGEEVMPWVREGDAWHPAIVAACMGAGAQQWTDLEDAWVAYMEARDEGGR